MSVNRVDDGGAGSSGGPMQSMNNLPWHRWQDWVNLILGIWLFITPWLWHTSAMTTYSTGGDWNAWILGIIVIIMSLWALGSPSMAFPEGVNIIAGIWLFFSPWIVGFSHANLWLGWNDWIVGIIVLILAASTMSHTSRSGQQHGHHGMA